MIYFEKAPRIFNQGLGLAFRNLASMSLGGGVRAQEPGCRVCVA